MSNRKFPILNGRPLEILLAACVTLAVALPPQAALAQVTGISYTLTPLAEGIHFSDDAALGTSLFYGGKLGFGFGEFIELNCIYLFSPGADAELGNLTGYDDATAALLAGLPARSLDMQRFGGELKFNLGRGSMLPFVTLGAGTLRFEPEGLNESNTIFISGGLGLQVSSRDRYSIVIQATGLGYRYNPAATLMSSDDLAALGMGADEFDLVNVRNFGASVGVKFYLGGRRSGELSDIDRAFQNQFSRGWRGVDFRVEPAGGEIDFDEGLGYRRNHRFATLSAGIDLGAYAGLRAFYWRGIEDGTWTTFDDLQAFGGELKIAFAEGSGGLTPYFTVGGGYMDVRNGYAGNGLAPVEDRPFAHGGIGLILPLSSALSIDASIRSILMSTAGVDNVSDPGAIETSTMFAVGVSFGLGGERRESVFGRDMEASKVDRQRLSSEVSALEGELRDLQARMDSMTAVAEGRPLRGVDSVAARAGAKIETEKTKWITLPVPEEGELYLRFGTPGGVSFETIEGEPVTYYLDPATGALMLAAPPALKPATPAPSASEQPRPAQGAAVPDTSAESLESMIQRVLREERVPAAPPAPAAADTTAARRAGALEARIKELETELGAMKTLTEEQRSTARRESTPIVIEVPAAKPAEKEKATAGNPPVEALTETPAERAEPREPSSIRFAGLSPLTGFNFNEPSQGLVGVRADFVHRTRPYRLAPEFIMGFGDGETTVNINLNGIYDTDICLFDRAYPYGGLGMGFLVMDDLELVLSFLIGSDIQIGTSTVFLEYVNQDFFDNNRLLTGYRFSF